MVSTISLKKALEPTKEKVVPICSDRELCKSAEDEGMEYIDPEERNALEKLSKIIG